MKPPTDCPDTNVRDVAFVRTTSAIGGRDAMEEYLADFCFGEIHDGITLVSKLKVPLSEFRATGTEEEDENQFLAKVELEVENVLGRCGYIEHEDYVKLLPNNDRLNQSV
jgi:hypothetical protein